MNEPIYFSGKGSWIYSFWNQINTFPFDFSKYKFYTSQNSIPA